MEPNRRDTEVAAVAHKHRKGSESQTLGGWPFSCSSAPSEGLPPPTPAPVFIESGRGGTRPQAGRNS